MAKEEIKAKMSKHTQEGAASIFIVIFTTILLSIITLSFVRIMVSESNLTINYNLSQSAYDSALAGIEDAKVALLRYHECISKGDYSSNVCSKAINAMRADGATENCDIVKDMLDRPGEDGETIVQSESQVFADDGVSEVGETIDQAYTCVKISENTNDYLGTLNQNYRTKIIPIRTAGNADDADGVRNVNRIELKWYNSEDSGKVESNPSVYNTNIGNGNIVTNQLGHGHDSEYTSSNNFSPNPLAPPAIQFQFIQTASTFTLNSFNQNSGDATNTGSLMLRPSTNGTNLITNSSSNGLAASANKNFNNTIDVRCDISLTNSYACSVDINLPNPIGGDRNEATTFVRLVLPYNAPDTSFSLKLYSCSNTNAPSSECTQIQFGGVQTKIDSTGRANDLFRRVEARVEMVDVYFPFPEFSATLSGGGSTVWKNFWVTNNCWYTNGDGTRNTCDNSGPL